MIEMKGEKIKRLDFAIEGSRVKPKYIEALLVKDGEIYTSKELTIEDFAEEFGWDASETHNKIRSQLRQLVAIGLVDVKKGLDKRFRVYSLNIPTYLKGLLAERDEAKRYKVVEV